MLLSGFPDVPHSFSSGQPGIPALRPKEAGGIFHSCAFWLKPRLKGHQNLPPLFGENGSRAGGAVKRMRAPKAEARVSFQLCR